jgi:hypothetical protein
MPTRLPPSLLPALAVTALLEVLPVSAPPARTLLGTAPDPLTGTLSLPSPNVPIVEARAPIQLLRPSPAVRPEHSPGVFLAAQVVAAPDPIYVTAIPFEAQLPAPALGVPTARPAPPSERVYDGALPPAPSAAGTPPSARPHRDGGR